MKSPHEILKEYLYLNPYQPPKPRKFLKDTIISGTALFREYRNTGTLYFLKTPQTIVIPVSYLDLWRSLDVSYGEPLLYIPIQGLSRLDLFIVGLEKFVKYLDTVTESTPDGLELLLVLARLGTSEIREFLDNLGVNFKPWTFESIQKTLEL